MAREPKSFDRVADRYDAERGGEDRGRAFATDLDPLFAGGGPALEIGIGTGVIAKGLTEIGRSVVGIDIAPLMLTQARQRIGTRVAVANAECLPVATARVDNAYSIWVLHLVDIAAVMTEVARVLRPGGRYVVSPAGEIERDAIMEIAAPMFRGIRGTAQRPDEPDRLAAIADAAGLRLVASVTGSEQRFTESPEQVARHIETRGGSTLWDVDEERWHRFVVPAVQALRALPDAAREIDRVSRPRILVFER